MSNDDLFSQEKAALICERCGARLPAGDNISLWGMYDNHTFKEYAAQSVDDFIEQWRADLKTESGSDISLCPIVVNFGEKELRRVGRMLAPNYQKGVPHDEAAVQVFRETAIADPDISRILQQSNGSPRQS